MKEPRSWLSGGQLLNQFGEPAAGAERKFVVLMRNEAAVRKTLSLVGAKTIGARNGNPWKPIPLKTSCRYRPPLVTRWTCSWSKETNQVLSGLLGEMPLAVPSPRSSSNQPLVPCHLSLPLSCAPA